MEKISKLGKDGEHSGGRQVRADTMTDLNSDMTAAGEFSEPGVPKKVRALTLGSAELCFGSGLKHAGSDENHHDPELHANAYLFSNMESPEENVTVSNDLHASTDAATVGRIRSNSIKRNVADMMHTSQEDQANSRSFSPLGADGMSSPGFASGSNSGASTGPGQKKSPGRKTRVYRSKSFEELESKAGKTSPPLVTEGVRKGGKGSQSPKVARKTSMKRSQSLQAVGSTSREYPFAEYSPTSVLGSAVIDYGWRDGMFSNSNVMVSKGTSTSVVAVDGSSLPSLFPDFDDLVRSMEVEDQSHQLQYVQYADMPLGSMQEDMEYDDLTQSCKEMWGSTNGAIQMDQAQLFQPVSGFGSTESNLKQNSSSSPVCSGIGGMPSSTEVSKSSSGASGVGSYTVPPVFEDGCLTDGFDELLY